MKQIILPFQSGEPELVNVPAPAIQPGQLLIRTRSSVVSAGTERMLVDFGKAGWIGKMRQQPQRVQDVLRKMKKDGIRPTIEAVRRKLDQPIPMGYSQCGEVIGIGAGVTGFRVGDRVASNGAHAEIVSVPVNLCAGVPEGVSDDHAAFAVLGAIALQSIRLCEPTFGETILVYGLGLIGQLTAQLLAANGCRVIGIDPDPQRAALAAGAGIIIPTDGKSETVEALTNGYGADAAIITASSSSDTIVNSAAGACRKRGRIVLSGVVGLTLDRDIFFKKELSFQVSTAYGPGRYEAQYEKRGLDYPIGYVRWTLNRNLEAVLTAMQRGSLNPEALISRRVAFENFGEVYSSLNDRNIVANLFQYSGNAQPARLSEKKDAVAIQAANGIGIIGAGSFATGVILPALKAADAELRAICSSNGLSAGLAAKKWNIPQAGSDSTELIRDRSIAALVIATPHSNHAHLTSAALDAGKKTFVEKPLALSFEELTDVERSLQNSTGSLCVGFNRRFAPLAQKAAQMLSDTGGPLNAIITVNAGALPPGHWTADTLNGGRILGEACHFIDLCAFFAGEEIEAVCANSNPAIDGQPEESASILLRFASGSNAVVNYFANGSNAYGKERIELYRAGKTVTIENWRRLQSFGFRKDVSLRATQDKGHAALIGAWVDHVQRGKPAPVSHGALINSSAATIAAVESLRSGAWVALSSRPQ
jgi:predicted dehydrogenase/threonine dehydrogenase-like Zn-dependent dehydrogenase